MFTLFQQLGIEHQKSCRTTPQQNGVLECEQKHLLKTARALFFQSNVPHNFWGECVMCAAYIINRLPLKCLNNLSPYQKFLENHLITLTYEPLVVLATCLHSKMADQNLQQEPTLVSS